MEQKKTYLVDNNIFRRGLYVLAGLSVAAYGYTDCWDLKLQEYYKNSVKPKIEAMTVDSPKINNASFPADTYNATDTVMNQSNAVDSSQNDSYELIQKFNQKSNYESNHRFLNSNREQRLKERMLDDLLMPEDTKYISNLPKGN